MNKGKKKKTGFLPSVSFQTPVTESPTICPIRRTPTGTPETAAARWHNFSTTHLLRAYPVPAAVLGAGEKSSAQVGSGAPCRQLMDELKKNAAGSAYGDARQRLIRFTAPPMCSS